MADKIRKSHYPNTDILYPTIRNLAGQVLRVSNLTFETWGTGGRSYTDYDVSGAGGGAGDAGCWYSEDMPAIAAGIYYQQFFIKIGSNPGDGDIPLDRELIAWDGSAIDINIQPAMVG
jgi:hypothetical protein